MLTVNNLAAAAVRRYFEDEGLRTRLRAHAADSVSAYRPERLLGTLVQTLEAVAR